MKANELGEGATAYCSRIVPTTRNDKAYLRDSGKRFCFEPLRADHDGDLACSKHAKVVHD